MNPERIKEDIMKKRLQKIAVLLLGMAILWPAATSLSSPAQEQLKATIDEILSVLKDDTLKGDAEKRRQALRDVIYVRFDFPKMAQLSLAKHWKQRTPEERETFTKLFSQLLEDTYVTKIEAYTNEKVVYVKERIKKKKAQVDTKIVTDTVEIPIDYRMYAAAEDQWRVYDLVIEGVSLVANYRSQFKQMMDSGSFDDLVKKLEQKLGS